MAGTEVKTKDVEGYLAAISKGSAIAAMLLRGIAFVVLAVNTLPLLLLCLSFVSPLVEVVSMEGTVKNASLVLIQTVFLMVPLWILSNVCREISRGVSPFSMVQVKRMRVIAVMIAAFALIDFLLEPGSLSLNCNGFVMGGYIHAYAYKINIAAIVAALALFLLSFVFEYGVMLQSVSDDVI